MAKHTVAQRAQRVFRDIVQHVRASRWTFPTVIITTAVILAVTSSWNDSLIVDEIPHIGAGYSYVVARDMHLNPEHPPLAKDLAGIALLTLGLDHSALKGPHWTRGINDQWEFGRALIYGTGNNADAITRVARLPELLFFIAAALLIFVWGRRLFGETAAAIALILFCFSPTVLAHARFVTTDVAALTGILAATIAFLLLLRTPSRRSFVIASVIVGLAFLTKFSTALLIPYLGFLAVLWGWLHGTRFRARIAGAIRWGFTSVAVFAVGFIIIVWPVYVYHTWSYPPARQHSDTTHLLDSFPNRPVADTIVWASDKPVLRAASWYATGLLMATQRAGGDNTITWLGQVVGTGGPLYFPLVYLIKEPLSWWALAFIALMVTLVRCGRIRGPSLHRTGAWLKENFEITAMVAWLVLYWVVSIRSPLNIGVRHILPTFPFAILLVAGQIAYFINHLRRHEERELRVFTLVIALLVAWGVFAQAHAWPSYLSYFNELAGGPSRGREIVTDSNLDWGQDLKRLSQFVAAQGIQTIQLDYFGWADPQYYMPGRFVPVHDSTYLDARDFLKRNPSGGWIAVSATYFEHSISRDNALGYRWLNAYDPVASIGNSILVWHLTR